MKRISLILIVIFLSILLILSFSVAGCKKEAAVDTKVSETTAGEATTAAETTAAATETVVAQEEELYILSSCIWGLDQLKPALWGGIPC